MRTAGEKIKAAAERIRSGLHDLAELEREDSALVDAVVLALVGHLRSWRPQALSPLVPPTGTDRTP